MSVMLCWSGSALYRWRHYFREKGIGFLSLFYSMGMSWSDDKSYGPNTTNTFLRLSPAIHSYWYLTLNQSTKRLFLFQKLEIYLNIFWSSCSIHFLFLSCYIEEITTNSLDKCYQEQNTVISIVCCKKLGMDDIPNICDGLSW